MTVHRVQTCARKRVFDAAASLLGLLAGLPILAVVACLIKCTSRGPVFFSQERVGRNGKAFKIVKFRTMHVGASRGGPVTVDGDARITRTGRFLRKTKLDEWPQLWNVLLGHMSLVGPRPDVPGFADRLEGEAREILRLRPGITGPATLAFRNEEQLLSGVPNPKIFNDTVLYPLKTRLNLEYLNRWSFRRDIAFILVTAFPFLDRWLKVIPRNLDLSCPAIMGPTTDPLSQPNGA